MNRITLPVTSLSIRNRQQGRLIDLRSLRRIILYCLRELLKAPMFDLGIQIVGTAEMTRLNERYLQHAGSTDVISFDYEEFPQTQRAAFVFGDIYVCIDEAVIQAKRFRTSWQEELVRYVVHGILHLLGYDDRSARLRRKMKRVEDGLVRALAARFPLASIDRRNVKRHG